MTTTDDQYLYQKKWRLDRARGIARLTDPAPARVHVAWLEECGLSRSAIAETAGISPTTVTHLMRGYDEKIKRRTSDAIHAVTPRAVFDRANPEAFVPKIGAIRRAQALLAIGWTAAHIADHAGLPAKTVHNIVNQPGQWITARLWRAIATTYDQLWDQPGPSTTNRARAPRNGWLPPLAWDDDQLDDPHAQPWRDDTPQSRSRGVAVAEHHASIDPIAVARGIAGDPPPKMTRAERVEAIRILAANGHADPAIADRLRTTQRTVGRLRAENDIPSRIEPSTGHLKAAS